MRPSRHDELALSSPRDRAAVKRLLQAAKGFHPPVTVTLAEIEAAAQNLRPLVRNGTRWFLAGAGAAVLLLLAGGVAVSRGWVQLWPRLLSQRPVAALSSARARIARQPAAAVAPPPTPAPPPPAALPISGVTPPAVPVGADPVAIPRSRRAGSPRAGVSGAPSPADSKLIARPSAPFPSPVLAEVTQMRDALKTLRADRDPAGALSLLDDYGRRFPAGLLHDEVSAMRVEALMALDRTDEALKGVEALPDAVLARWPRLRILRGELRAKHGRCADAMIDFGTLLTRPDGDNIRQRAEAGRDACVAQRGKADPPL